MKKISLPILILGLSLTLIHCGDSDGSDAPESTTTLTESQVAAVTDAISEAIGSSLPIDTGRLSARAQSVDVDSDEPCDGGGTVSVNGTYSVDSSSETGSSGSASVSQVFNDCGVMDGNDVIFLDGTIDTDTDFDFTISGESDFSGTVTSESIGSLDVEGDTVTEGVCGVSISFTANLNGSGGSITATVNVCGVTDTITEPIGD